jgi:hypothetical protein
MDYRQDRDLFGAFARLGHGTTGFLSLLGRRELQRDLLARLDGLLLRMIPRTWHIVWFGAALK